jgi:zinc protease
MRTSNKFLCLLALTTLVLNGCKTVSQAPTAPAADAEAWRAELPFKETQPTPPAFPQILTDKLSNGLQIYVVQDARLPIAQVQLTFKNGSAADPAKKAGLLYVTALMLNEGAGPHSSLGLSEEFANLGTSVSVGAGKDSAYIAAAALSDKVPKLVELIALMAKAPLFNQEDYNRVVAQHLNTLISKQALPAYVAQENFLKAAYGENHPYGHATMGTMASVNAMTLADIKSIHKTHFGPNNAGLIVVGDVTLDDVKSLAQAHLGSWKNVAKVVPVAKTLKPSTSMQTVLAARSSSPQSYILVGRPLVVQGDPMLPSYEVLGQILGSSSPSSRLGINLRERKGWTYGVQNFAMPLHGPGPMMIGTSIQVPFGSDAIGEILKEFEKIKTEIVTEKELNAVKNNLLRSFNDHYSTIGKVASEVETNFLYNLPTDYAQNYYARLEKVSADDILKAANKVFEMKNLVAVAVGDPETMEAGLSKMNVGKVTVVKEEAVKAK